MVAAADLIVAQAFERQGFQTLTTGWPDILAYNDKRQVVMAVEVKRGTDRLRPTQVEMQRVFTERMGVPFHVVNDRNIEAMLRKRGRVMMPGASLERLHQDYGNVKWRIEQAERALAEARARYEEALATISATTMIFEQVVVANPRSPSYPALIDEKVELLRQAHSEGRI